MSGTVMWISHGNSTRHILVVKTIFLLLTSYDMSQLSPSTVTFDTSNFSEESQSDMYRRGNTNGLIG